MPKHVFNRKTFDTEEAFMAEVLSVKAQRDRYKAALEQVLGHGITCGDLYQKCCKDLEGEIRKALKDES